jgi:hypothetical protein
MPKQCRHATCEGDECRREKKLTWRTKPKPMSTKRGKELAQYTRDRKAFLADNPICGVPDCTAPATEVHHKKGRENGLLLEKRWWLQICNPHHRHYTDNSREAIEAGISISKHKKAS